MKHRIVNISEVMEHPNMSLSAKDYLEEGMSRDTVNRMIQGEGIHRDLEKQLQERDAYKERASKMFGVPYEEVTAEQRKVGKLWSFHEIYNHNGEEQEIYPFQAKVLEYASKDAEVTRAFFETFPKSEEFTGFEQGELAEIRQQYFTRPRKSGIGLRLVLELVSKGIPLEDAWRKVYNEAPPIQGMEAYEQYENLMIGVDWGRTGDTTVVLACGTGQGISIIDVYQNLNEKEREILANSTLVHDEAILPKFLQQMELAETESQPQKPRNRAERRGYKEKNWNKKRPY